MFRDREEAGYQLADRLKGRACRDPVVLAIPRGGVVIGAIIAHELGMELDVVLARKLGAPGQPELAIGAIAESGVVYLNPNVPADAEWPADYLLEERRSQLAEIARRRALYRRIRPPARLAGRTVIVVDDGIAGSTMIAALKAIRAQGPYEVIVAVPVGAPDRLDAIRAGCDEVVCLLVTETLCSVGQYYEDFTQVEDEQVVAILNDFAPGRTQAAKAQTVTT